MALSGNHETTYKNGSNEIFKHFNNKLPEQASTLKGYFYSYVYGNAKFIMLNTNDLSADKLTDEQYNWLVSELKNNQCAWTIVGMHCPMYGVGQWGADTSKNQQSLALRSQLQGIFAQYGVDIVLQGHDHTVSRTYPINAIGEVQPESKENIEGVEYTVNPSGVFYLASGTSGGQTEKPVIVNSTNQHLYAYTGKSNKAMWTEFEIDGNMMKVIVKYTDGTNVSVYQTWGIKKSA
jgi:phosphodiesterase/alkaline phosphatase D-like protein